MRISKYIATILIGWMIANLLLYWIVGEASNQIMIFTMIGAVVAGIVNYHK
jgi:hypothetical protein